MAQSTVTAGSVTQSSTANAIEVKTGDATSGFHVFASDQRELLRVSAAPGVFFHVNGAANQWMLVQRGTKAMYVNPNWGAGNAFAQIAPRGSDGMGLSLSSNDNVPEHLFITHIGEVGVGTKDPFQRLSVVTSAEVNGGAREVFGIYDTSPMAAGVGAAIAFGGRYSSNSSLALAQQFSSIQGVKENGTDGDYAGALAFLTRVHGGNPVERVRVTSTGRVGIGVTNPDAMLHVGGGARFDGIVTGTEIRAHYQDLAEWVPANQDLAAGTVVVLDRSVGNGVMASGQAYDTTVAGVVSEQPGIILGVAGAEKEQVATTGRVRVRVDASAGAIAVGDLLVTSSKPGRAMRSEPMDINGRKFHQPGTIIGKALEPLESGEGEILVLLSMQ